MLLLQSPSSSSSAVSRASEYLREMGGRGEVEWAVLRASLLQREYFRLVLPSSCSGGLFGFGLALVGLAVWLGFELMRLLVGVDRKLCPAGRACQGHPGGEQDLLGDGGGEDPVGVGRGRGGCCGAGVDGSAAAEYRVFGLGAGVAVVRRGVFCVEDSMRKGGCDG